MSNPKNIVGISKPIGASFFKQVTQCSCNNCGEKWTIEFEVYGVAGRSEKIYDHCSECVKRSKKK